MSPLWTAFAYATELSERTFAATAALIGAATFALISDIAARSGSSSPASSFSSSRERALYSWGLLPMSVLLSLVRLRDVGGLLRVGIRGRAVAQYVQCNSCIDGCGHVRVDERHRGALRQLL